jgi:hypothetical protein
MKRFGNGSGDPSFIRSAEEEYFNRIIFFHTEMNLLMRQNNMWHSGSGFLQGYPFTTLVYYSCSNSDMVIQKYVR